jgi:hypothetical protein
VATVNTAVAHPELANKTDIAKNCFTDIPPDFGRNLVETGDGTSGRRRMKCSVSLGKIHASQESHGVILARVTPLLLRITVINC